MLPSLNLLLGDSATTELTSPSAAPDGDAAPGAFAEQLGLLVPATGDAALESGEPLPPAGNELPDPVLASGPGLADPEAIVASLQRELRALSDSADDELQAPIEILDISIDGTSLEVQLEDAGMPDLREVPRQIESASLPVMPIGSADIDDATPRVLQESVVATGPEVQAVLAEAPELQAELARSPVVHAAPVQNAIRDTAPGRVVSYQQGALEDLQFRPQTLPTQKITATPATSLNDTLVSAAQPSRTALLPDQSDLVLPSTAERSSLESIAFGNAQKLSVPGPTTSLTTPLVPELAAAGAVQGRMSIDPQALPPSPAPTTTITTPFQESNWDSRFADKIVLMAKGQLQSADIRLTPAELGPVRVRLSIEGGEANVAFVAQQAVTRDAIEQAMPRLRELLAENGLTLGQSSVGDEGVPEGQRDSEQSHTRSGGAESSVDDAHADSNPDSAPTARVAKGLVDTFV